MADGEGSLGPTEMFRLNAFSRNYSDLTPLVRSFSRFDRNEGHFLEPELSELLEYRIVVSTCTSAGRFWSLGIQEGKFSHVVIDEAGQATEPEAIIPLAGIVGPSSRVILAGDPKQVHPPSCHSPHHPFSLAPQRALTFTSPSSSALIGSLAALNSVHLTLPSSGHHDTINLRHHFYPALLFPSTPNPPPHIALSLAP